MTRLSTVMSVDEENSNSNGGLEKPHDPDRSREWFGVQLEVINLLLEAERRKLCVLQRELKTALEEGGSIKAKEHQKQELIAAIQRIQLQYDNLEKECRQHAIGALKASNTRGIGKGKIGCHVTPNVLEGESDRKVVDLSNEKKRSKTNKSKTVASKNIDTVSIKLAKDLKLDNLESGQAKLKRTIQNGTAAETPPPVIKVNEGKPKPPVPPKRSTLTFGKSYVSVGDSNCHDSNSTFSPTGVPPHSESFEESCQPVTSHLVTVTTNILSSTPKGLPVPRAKNQRVLSTFLPALPPKFCKSPQAQSPNFPRTTSLESKTEPEKVLECQIQKPERRISEKESTSPSSLSSSTKTQSSSTSIDKDNPRDETDSLKSSGENSSSKAEEFSPSQSPPLLPESPSKFPIKSPPLPDLPPEPPVTTPPSEVSSSPVEKSPPLRQNSSSTKDNATDLKESQRVVNDKHKLPKTEEDVEDDGLKNLFSSFYSEDSNEKTNTIKRAPTNDPKNTDASKDRLTAGGVKLRPKSPIRVSFGKDECPGFRIYENLSRPTRATTELKNFIYEIENSGRNYCSDDSCRPWVIQKTSSLSRRRSTSPKTTFSTSADLLEGYTSCYEEGTKVISKKTKNLTRKAAEKNCNAGYSKLACRCPYENLIIDNRLPLSRPNSSIGDYCSQSGRSRSAVRVQKNSGCGIKTPFLTGNSKLDHAKPGLGLIVTVSSDGIDQEPKRTVQFISGSGLNFGLGGTLGRYNKCKSQDNALKLSDTSFLADHPASEFEDIKDGGNLSDKSKDEQEAVKNTKIKEETTQKTTNDQNDNTKKHIPALERQKSLVELRRPRTIGPINDLQNKPNSDSTNRKKSPGEVLEHFGKLATSVTTSEISKISNSKKTTEEPKEDSVKEHIKAFEKITKSGNQNHAFENYRTVPPTSFNNPDPYLGSAFVQYVRETLPHQPNSFPGGASSAFNKYIRPGSGRFDKSLILPQKPKSDKPSAFERLCGDKIYSSRRGIYGKSSTQNQNVSGSLDCVWGKPKTNEQPKATDSETETNILKDSRPASCTYEINRGRVPRAIPSNDPYSNYSTLGPIYGQEKAASGIPRTSKKGILEFDSSSLTSFQLPEQTANFKSQIPQGVKNNSPQCFNAQSLENYKLAPGFKRDLSTLYSGVFYTTSKQDGAWAKLSDSSRILNQYGNNYSGTLDRSKENNNSETKTESMGTSSSSGRGPSADTAAVRKSYTGGVASVAAATRIPEEAPPGVTVTYPAQYQPTEEELLEESIQSNRSQPAIGLKQTPKSRPTIFGTVASGQVPKDGSSRRSLPQTTLGASNGGLTEYSSSLESVQETTPERDNALVYRDGNLVSGSMEALVQHMVPTAEYYPDRAYIFAFLLSSRLFIKPHELLGEVCALCASQQHLGGKDPPSKERLGRFIPHFVQLLAEWTETFPYDFRDERVMVHVRNITQKCVTVDPSIRKEVSTLLQNLLVRLTTLEKYEEFLSRINAENSTDCLDGLISTDVTELCASPGLLAQQLTHIELERLSYIGPEEFVQAFAKENPNLGTSFKDMKKTKNLESYVSWFNRLSFLVATDVCKNVKKKQRARVMEYWIETARECFNIGNFNSLMAIIAGLNMSPVARLKKTWSKIQSAKFSVLEHQMDPSSNFSSYRSTLKAAMWRSAGATDQRQRIVIPFFSLLVKDLYFLNEGCSNKLPNGHINFEKFWQLAKQVTEFITWKQVACPFDKCTKVITFLQASPVLTENALALASFECEPPENNSEKERYKSLK